VLHALETVVVGDRGLGFLTVSEKDAHDVSSDFPIKEVG